MRSLCRCRGEKGGEQRSDLHNTAVVVVRRWNGIARAADYTPRFIIILTREYRFDETNEVTAAVYFGNVKLRVVASFLDCGRAGPEMIHYQCFVREGKILACSPGSSGWVSLVDHYERINRVLADGNLPIARVNELVFLVPDTLAVHVVDPAPVCRDAKSVWELRGGASKIACTRG